MLWPFGATVQSQQWLVCSCASAYALLVERHCRITAGPPLGVRGTWHSGCGFWKQQDWHCLLLEQQSAGRQENRPRPCFCLPAPDPCKHGLFPYDAVATEGRLGTGKAAASAGQVLTVPSVMVPLCLSPVYDQPNFLGFLFSSSGVCPFSSTPSLFFLFPRLNHHSLSFSSVCVCTWKWVGENWTLYFWPLE